jgi:hypothetical protein
VVPLQVFTASSGIQPDLTGVIYRWVATDLPTNTALNSWTDQVQQLTWTNQTSANRPTNSGVIGDTGVWFDNTHWFTNAGLTGLTLRSNIAFGFIFKMVDVGQFSGEVHPGLLNNTAQLTSDDVHVFGLMFNFNTTYPLAMQNSSSFGNISEAPYKTTNVISDLVFTQTITNTGNGAWRAYTNGILDVISAGTMTTYWGQSGGDPTPSIPNSLARNRTRASSAFFRLKELWVWTNGVPGDASGVNLPATQLANFHKYGTNAYGYSP